MQSDDTTLNAAPARNSHNSGTVEWWLAARLRQRAIRRSWLPSNEQLRRVGAYRSTCEIPVCREPQIPLASDDEQ